ncbi:MAG: VWA domain-containing protein [Armatimonadetes bacterium]|nr:VWA domain-containing protein [Armatimonadota bacterium]MDW8120846.1 VWA domain-containing protein [Armatimonadota bacterium]
MKRGLILWLALLAVTASVASPCGIIVPPRPGPSFSLKYRHMKATIADGTVLVEARQAFVNEAPFETEGIYLFPVPDGAAVHRFALVIDGKTYEGELMSREEARRTYERIVGARKDPALLELIGRQTFRLRIFPFPPQGQRETEVHYDQVLSRQGNLYRFVYPMKIEGLSARPAEEATITIRISSRRPIKTVYSPTHPVSVRRPDDHTAIVTYEERNVKPVDDFTLYYSVAEGPMGATLLTYRERGDKDGYFLVFLTPQLAWDKRDQSAKDVVFVLDRTGSMSGKKIEQAKEALKFCVESLNPEDRFSVIVFNESPDLLWEDLREANSKNKKEAIRFFEDVTASGGTNINDALLEALSLFKMRRHPRYILFLTDGLPTVGITDTDRILANVAKANEAKVRLFVFGVGYDVNTQFLDRLARDNGGVSFYVRPEEAVEGKISELFSMLSQPVFTDVKARWDGVSVRDVYPKEIPDIFRGTEVTLAGTYREKGDATLTLTGQLAGKEESLTFRLSFPERDTENDFVPRIWAARKIGYLLDELADVRGASRTELIDEILRLSRQFGVLTEFTAFLVLEPHLPVPLARERVRRDLEEARLQTSGPWAVAQALNRQALQRATSDYELRAGSQAPLRRMIQAAPSAAPSLGGFGGLGWMPAAPAGQAIIDREGKVVILPGARWVAGKAFVQKGTQWVDTLYDPDQHRLISIQQFSPAAVKLTEARSVIRKWASLGEDVIVVLDDKTAVRFGPSGKEDLSEEEIKELFRAVPQITAGRSSEGTSPQWVVWSIVTATSLVAVTTLLYIGKRMTAG